jgi:hypothetical protein
VVLKAGDVIADFKVAPSPFSNVLNLTISVPAKSHCKFRLSTVEGRTIVVTEREVKAGVNNLIINVPRVCKGVYVLTMKNSEGTVSRKVLKQ